MKNVTIFTIVLMTMTGCAGSQYIATNLTRSEIIDDPEIGVATTRRIGDRLVEKGVRTQGPAFQITSPITTTVGLLNCKLTFQANQTRFVDYLSAESGDYCASGFNAANSCLGESIQPIYPICKSRAGAAFYYPDANGSLAPLSGSGVSEISGVVTTGQNFVQELIYNGRVSDSLRFIYREFSNDMLRASFTQEIQYDLNISTEIGFQNLLLNVEEATNTNITYRVIRTF